MVDLIFQSPSSYGGWSHGPMDDQQVIVVFITAQIRYSGTHTVNMCHFFCSCDSDFIWSFADKLRWRFSFEKRVIFFSRLKLKIVSQIHNHECRLMYVLGVSVTNFSPCAPWLIFFSHLFRLKWSRKRLTTSKPTSPPTRPDCQKLMRWYFAWTQLVSPSIHLSTLARWRHF